MAVFDELERGGFSDTESRLARYIVDHAAEVTHGSIGQLAQATYTSNATIIRLCHKLGVSGFRELKVELAAALEKRRVARHEVDADYPFASTADTAEALARIAQLTKEAVDGAYAALDPGVVDEVARWIRTARNVYAFAHGDTQLTAEAFLNLLLKLGIHGTVAGRYGEEASVANAAEAGDVAFFVTYGGTLLDGSMARRVLPLLRERGCKTVLITAAPRPSLWIDRTISFPLRERVAGKMATFYSQACIRYVLNCLYAAVYALDYAGSTEVKNSADGVRTFGSAAAPRGASRRTLRTV